jgi:beta-glucanase (GH16 family)
MCLCVKQKKKLCVKFCYLRINKNQSMRQGHTFNSITLALIGTLLAASVSLNAQTLVWEEKFNKNTINGQTWTYDLGNGCEIDNCGWGNSEMEYYTNRKENARIGKGHLIIEARREAYNDKPFTSARLKTEGRMHFKYGTVEARIKLPNVNKGVWPAFWTLGTVGGSWPSIGEIDMMEIGSKEALKDSLGNKRVSSAAHWSKADGSHTYNVFYRDAPVDLSEGYHLYKMVWTPQFIKMYLDNVEYYSFDISGGAAANVSEFHNPHYLLLNIAVGGSYTGIFTEGGINADFPSQMHVDYIRLYQNKGDTLYLAPDSKGKIKNKYAVLLVNKPPTITNNDVPEDTTHLSHLTAAPTPTRAAHTVISLFSNAYVNKPIDTWSASWDRADVTNTLIEKNETKRYSKLNYAGIEFAKNPINATAATHLHIDIWTPNAATFKVKLVDFGDNAIYQGTTNDDSEHELSFTPALGKWVSYDMALSDFKGLKAHAHLAQLILTGSNSRVYVDNVYFFNDAGKTVD